MKSNLEIIEQHIIDGKDEQFIMNCLQAVGIKFIEAVRNNFPNIVRFMIDRGVNIHFDNDLALCSASLNGHLEVVKLLLAAGADVHAEDDSALLYASMKGHSEVVKLLEEVISNELLTTN